MTKFKNIILTVISIIGLLGCSKDLLKEKPPTFITADVLYTTLAGFDSGINGLYSLVRDERNGLGYTGGFGEVDLKATIFLVGTDNIATGSNSGGFSTIVGDWTKNTATDPNIDKVFLWLYQVVSASNTIITRADNPNINWGTGNNKERVVAEARTIRAWAYRHLTYLWGDVPLIVTEVSGSNIRTDFTREKVATIRRVMIEDLKYAAVYLPWLPAKAGRLTRGVAETYLAETYLAMGKPDSALICTNDCINNGPYSLVKARYGAGLDKPGSAFMDMFTPSKTNIADGNTEALWVMQWERSAVGGGDNLMRHESTMRYESAKYSGRSQTAKTSEDRGGRGWSRQTITKNALLLYYSSSDKASGKIDQRGMASAIRQYYIVNSTDDFSLLINSNTGKQWVIGDTIWLATPVSKGLIPDPGKRSKSGAFDFNLLSATALNGNDWPYSMKFAQCDPGYPTATESHFDQIYMRLAETILLRAEARGRLGDLAGAAADINMLRDRANAKQITVANFGATTTTFLDYILDERSRELLLEEQRRYTLLRMGGANFFFRRVSTFNNITKNLTLRDTLFPIPQTVIDANLTLPMSQNPGFNN